MLFETFTRNRILEELIYGSIAGSLLCLGGHPFDTLKTRIQMERLSLLSTVKNIMLYEGPMGYYKGISGPLASVPIINAVIFASFEFSRRAIEVVRNREVASLFDIGLAGGIAGLFNTSVVTPIELVKCKMQMQRFKNQYRSSFDCGLQIYRQKGLLGLYQGNSITLVREVSGNAAQFFTYEWLKRNIFGPTPLFIFDDEPRRSVQDRRLHEIAGSR